MEWGNYNRNSDPHRVIASQSFDENGDTGLTDFSDATGAPELYAEIEDDAQLVISFDEDPDGTIDGSITFMPQVDDGIVGTWIFRAENDQPANENDLLVLIFNADGTYLHGEVEFDNLDEDSGMEWGTYSIDAETHKVTVAQTFDANGDTGLTDFSSGDGPQLFISESNDILTLQIDENNDGTNETELLFQRQ